MRYALGWLWFIALILEFAGIVAVIFRLTPPTERFSMWWRRAFGVLLLEMCAHFMAVVLRDPGCLQPLDSGTASTVARWCLVLFVWVNVGMLYGKLK